MKFPSGILFCCSLLILLVGCAPSIRYTRNADGKVQYLVPRNWDYRKNYKVPQNRIESIASKYLGIPYRYGGMSRRGIDCSGLVCLVYKDVSGAKLPHSSRKLRRCSRLVSLSSAQAGDLVFFKGDFLGMITHVGIYLGNNRFIHASSKQGVMYSSLEQKYFKEHFAEVRRIF